MLTRIAYIFGIVFVVIGILGFIPAFTPDGYLLGLFQVDGLHNLVHLATGIAAIIAGFASPAASRTFFQVFAVIYGIVALVGLFYGSDPLLGIMAHNWADFWLHVLITAVAAYVGFGVARREPALRHAQTHR